MKAIGPTIDRIYEPTLQVSLPLKYGTMTKLPSTVENVYLANQNAQFNLHSYIMNDDGELRVMWTSSPAGQEVVSGKRVRHSKKVSGSWVHQGFVTPSPSSGRDFIARDWRGCTGNWIG